MSNQDALSKVEKENLEDLDLPLRGGATNLVFGKGSADAKIILFDIILYITKSIAFIITLNNAMRIDPFTGTLKTADR